MPNMTSWAHAAPRHQQYINWLWLLSTVVKSQKDRHTACLPVLSGSVNGVSIVRYISDTITLSFSCNRSCDETCMAK